MGLGTPSAVVAMSALGLIASACGRTAGRSFNESELGDPARAGAGRQPAQSAGIASPPLAGRHGNRPRPPIAGTADPTGGNDPDEDPPLARASRCRVTDRFTLVSEPASNTFAFAAAVAGDRFGILWLDEGVPWRLRFQAFTLAGRPIAEAVTLSEVSLRPKVVLSARGDSLVAAWVDYGGGNRIRFTTFEDGQLSRDRDLAQSATGDDPSMAVTEEGRVVLSWTRRVGDDGSQSGFERVYAESTDGVSFGEPAVLDSGLERLVLASSVAIGETVAHAWVARTITPNHSALAFARTERGVTVSPPVVLVEHDRYIYETAMAVAAGRLGLGTTDSRVNIGAVPIYLTLLESGGRVVAEGIRLTADYHHQSIDIAAGSHSFVLLSDAFVDTESENRVFLRQVDRDGNDLFEPLRVSADEVPPGTRSSQKPRLSAIGPDRYLAVWGEREAHNPRTVYVIRAGIVDCR